MAHCDVVHVPGRGAMCAPSLLVPGLGKCGTNAIKTYTELHPRMRWPDFSETAFDPSDISVADFVREHNPDGAVVPGSGLMWAAKHPGMEKKDPYPFARR